MLIIFFKNEVVIVLILQLYRYIMLVWLFESSKHAEKNP